MIRFPVLPDNLDRKANSARHQRRFDADVVMFAETSAKSKILLSYMAFEMAKNKGQGRGGDPYAYFGVW